MKKQFGSGGTPRGLTIQTGSRGGKYHITASGNKSYTPVNPRSVHVVNGELTTGDELNAMAKKHGVAHHSAVPGYSGEYGKLGTAKVSPPPKPKPTPPPKPVSKAVPPPKPAKAVAPPKPVPPPKPPPTKAALPPKPPPRPAPPPTPPKPVMPDPAKLFNEPPASPVLKRDISTLTRSDVPSQGKEALDGLRAAGLTQHLGPTLSDIYVAKGNPSIRLGGQYRHAVLRSSGTIIDGSIRVNGALAARMVEGGYGGKPPFTMGQHETVYPNKASGVTGIGYVAIHEGTHAWMYNHHGTGSANYYGRIVPGYRRAKAEGKLVSRYAGVNADEWFAETHSAYVLHGPALKAYHPGSWQLMHDLRKESGIE